MAARTGMAAIETAAIERAAGGFYGNRLDHASVAFKEETGALLLFRPDRVQLYKAGWRPEAMVKTRTSGAWRFNRGGGLLDLNRARRVARDAARQAAEGGSPAAVGYGARCLQRFVARIPVEIGAALRGFPARTWQLYAFLARCGDPAFELAATNRALALCLANAWVFAARPVRWELRRIRGLLRHRRRRIAGALGFPASDAAVRVLGRVSAACLDIAPLLFLRDALADEAIVRRLAHLPHIDRDVVRIVSDPALRPHASQRLLLELSGRSEPPWGAAPVARELRDVLELLDERPRRSLVFRSVAHLRRVGAEAVDELAARRPDVCVVLPPPPAPGVPGLIEPLTSDRALVFEGRRMRNCLRDEATVREARGRPLAWYRVLAPERCTLAIRPALDGTWRIDDLRGWANGSPSHETLATVVDWMRSWRRPPPPPPAAPSADGARAGPEQLALPFPAPAP